MVKNSVYPTQFDEEMQNKVQMSQDIWRAWRNQAARAWNCR